jgi:hypothetical protein
MGGLYAHWLDPQTARVANEQGEQCQFEAARDRALRLSALFGQPVVLSGAQFVDSDAVRELFLDPVYTDLAARYDLLRLIVRPSEELEKRTTSNLLVATFQRPLQEGWLATSMEDATPIRRVAKRISTEGPEVFADGAALAEVIARLPDPSERKYIRALGKGLRYFLHSDAVESARGPADTTYWSLMLDSVDAVDNASHRYRINETLEFVERALPEEQRHFRSDVLTALLRRNWSEESQAIWRTVVSAYNEAVAISLNPEGSTFTRSGESSSLGKYTALTKDFLTSNSEQTQSLYRDLGPQRIVGGFRWDPKDLSWTEVRDTIAKTEDSWWRLRNARESGTSDEVEDALEEHCRGLSKVFLPPSDPVSPMIWMLGRVGVAFADYAGLVPREATLAFLGAEAAYRVSNSELVLRLGRYRFASKLRKSGRSITSAAVS